MQDVYIYTSEEFQRLLEKGQALYLLCIMVQVLQGFAPLVLYYQALGEKDKGL